PLAESLLKPERLPVAPALAALAGGLLLGAATAGLPSAISGDETKAEARFLVGGALSAAGIVSLFARRPGRSIPGHVAHNDSLRSAWRAHTDQVMAGNRVLLQDVRLRIRARPLLRIEHEPR
ncbi:MAG: hypothetical protein HY560_11435, partial [Gemmatimonadetes bacterium]|nr:hypothetical protein [Gemmatimonadota bacterium]